jgi:hypothetical protein
MNWIFEAYSNVYNAALMQDRPASAYAAPAKVEAKAKRFSLLKPFARG